MKTSQPPAAPLPGAFTLIELLVVIAIMAVLAAMIFPVAGSIKRKTIKTKAQTELAQVAAAIDRYKSKYGFFPPDSRPNPVINQLYFELVGTTNLGNGRFQTLDGSVQIDAAGLNAAFGAQVSGFVNCSASGAGDDGPVAVRFLTGLKPTQIAELSPAVKLLVCSVRWPEDLVPPLPALPGVNPWRYDSSSTNRHNLDSYDLWVDILIGDKTNRISNWNKQPEIVQ